MTTTLLVIVEVDKSQRVICQAPGCGHAVYKRIHVVKTDDGFSVLGSECFKKLFGDMQTTSTPYYGTSDGRKLSPEEHQQLVENTATFIDFLESERFDQECMAQLRQADEDRVRAEQTEQLRHRAAQLSTPKVIMSPFQYPDTARYAGYDGPAGMHWMWVRDLRESAEMIRQYKESTYRAKDMDLVLRLFGEGSRSDPWGFAQCVVPYGIPVKVTLSILHDFKMIVRLPAYR